MAQVRLTVSVADGHLAQSREVADRLRRQGMRVEEVLEEVGIITGAADDAEIPNLGSLEGVAGVERQAEFQLPPPDAPIQ